MCRIARNDPFFPQVGDADPIDHSPTRACFNPLLFKKFQSKKGPLISYWQQPDYSYIKGSYKTRRAPDRGRRLGRGPRPPLAGLLFLGVLGGFATSAVALVSGSSLMVAIIGYMVGGSLTLIGSALLTGHLRS